MKWLEKLWVSLSLPTPFEDEFIWGPASHGRFTIKSATWLQLQDKQEHNRIQLIKKLWSLDIQPKIKFFGWLMLRGGFIIRTDSGNPILAAAFNCGRANVPVTEAMALRNSLIQARELGVTNVQVEGDSKLVIDVANGHSTSTICMLEGCVPPEAAMALSFDIVNVGCSRGTSL
ncbi:hypothetical protein ACLB2K_011334 [Fragaria x ananassa]